MTAPIRLEPVWCAPACHDRTHQDDDYHCSDIRTVPRTRGGHVEVWVDQYDEDGESPDVVLRVVGPDLDLKALDARQLARVLLAAADIADGVSAGW